MKNNKYFKNNIEGMKYLFLIVIALCLIVPSVMSVCTVSFDRSGNYTQGETISAQSSCSEVDEKLDSYTLNWTNASGDQIQLNIGTTPNNVDESFFHTFFIPLDYVSVNGTNITATLQGTDLEGSDTEFISSALTNDLIVSDISVGGKYLGLVSNVQGIVKDENGKLITGGECEVDILNNDATQHLITVITKMTEGEVRAEFVLDYTAFDEGLDYVVETHCFCGSIGGLYECMDEDGNNITYSDGEAQSPFTTNTWITFNDEDNIPIVYENGSDYPNAVVFAGFDEKHYWLINVSNSRDEELEFRTDGFLINNETKELFVSNGERINRPFSIPAGNSTTIASSTTPKEAPTGVYFIRIFVNVLFKNILVAQYIQDTETFNVTGTDDTLIINNVVTDKRNYYTGEQMHTCINITNNFNKRLEFEVSYNMRCSLNDLDSDTDRSILDKLTELRAVSPGETQNQCADLNVPYHRHLLYKTSQCYSSITVESRYINTFDNKKSLTSPQFNITDFGFYPEYELNPTYPLINLFPDWRRFDDVIDGVDRSYFRAKVNISALEEQKLDSTDLITNGTWDIFFGCTDNMPRSTDHYNYTILDASGNIIDNEIEAKSLQTKIDGEIRSICAIEVENVDLDNITDEYFEIIIWYEDFEERSTEAFEDIANKTGTFRLSVDCPSPSYIGGVMTCQIQAQVESASLFEEEVDFTCYILDENSNRYSTINFNQMITKDIFTIQKDFLIPSTFINKQEYTLRCEGGYYPGLGSRIDRFSDTFVAKKKGRFMGYIPYLAAGVGIIFILILFSLYFVNENKETKKTSKNLLVLGGLLLINLKDRCVDFIKNVVCLFLPSPKSSKRFRL